LGILILAVMIIAVNRIIVLFTNCPIICLLDTMSHRRDKGGAMKNFGYPAERFRSAVQALRLPHPEGKADAIDRAFYNCGPAFQDLGRDDLDESAKEWAPKIDEFPAIDCTGAEAQAQRPANAEKLSSEQKCELTSRIYKLGATFHAFFRSRSDEV